MDLPWNCPIIRSLPVWAMSHIMRQTVNLLKEACKTAEKLKIPNLILYHTEEKNLKNRKKLYTEEGKAYYYGNLYVPYDLETFRI